MASDEPIMASVAGRYASALYELASEQRQVAEVERSLVDFQGLIDQSADLRRLIRSPVFSAEEQIRAIAAILASVGIGGLAGNFLLLAARNRRLFAVPDMIESFRVLTARARGEVQAEVASAIALGEAQMQALRATLEAAVGKRVQITSKVDPSLLGGLVVKVGSRMIDNSLRTKLDSLKIAMKGTG